MSAPKDEPKQWWTCGDAEITIKTHGSRAKLSFQVDAGWRTLNDLLDLAKQHTKDPDDITGITRETENTPAPKIYVPAPGRPPEWVVDLMVEGRIARVRDRWFHVSPHEGELNLEFCKGQAIRLNDDGSLEIIDAPCEHDWRVGQHATFANGAGSATRRILRCEKCRSEVVEAFDGQAKEWRETWRSHDRRNDHTWSLVSRDAVQISLRDLAKVIGLDWEWPE